MLITTNEINRGVYRQAGVFTLMLNLIIQYLYLQLFSAIHIAMSQIGQPNCPNCYSKSKIRLDGKLSVLHDELMGRYSR